MQGSQAVDLKKPERQHDFEALVEDVAKETGKQEHTHVLKRVFIPIARLKAFRDNRIHWLSFNIPEDRINRRETAKEQQMKTIKFLTGTRPVGKSFLLNNLIVNL